MAYAKKKQGGKSTGGRPSVLSVARKAKGGAKRGRRPSVRVSTRGRYSKSK